MLATLAAAEAKGRNGEREAEKAPAAAKGPERTLSPQARLAYKRGVARKQRSVIRFFAKHRWLLRAAKHQEKAHAALRRAHVRLAGVRKDIAAIRRFLNAREARRRLNPRIAICDVFGAYCRQALSVAWCESRLRPTAQNGQYLGLFQMGAWERSLFGHGSTARAQARAAYRYFVVSGRDWSPWSCKPAYW